MRDIDLAVNSDVPVLILGPTGSGKTSLARQIHESGSRQNKPFIVVNLGALHEGTFESELFGHEKGAFTGADFRRIGRLEVANGGTVFLDEIGDLPLKLQTRLLEFLQSKVFSPVGSNREVRVDVRVIAATHQNLVKAVQEGRFRADLFHRLRFLTVDLPSLVDWDGARFNEVIHQIIQSAARAFGKVIHKLSSDVALRLEGYSWPGNLRELKAVLEYAVLAVGPNEREILPSHLPAWFGVAVTPQSLSAAAAFDELNQNVEEFRVMSDFYEAVRCFEKSFLERALKRNRGRLNFTARQIGVNKSTLHRKLRHLGLEIDKMKWG